MKGQTEERRLEDFMNKQKMETQTKKIRQKEDERQTEER